MDRIVSGSENEKTVDSLPIYHTVINGTFGRVAETTELPHDGVRKLPRGSTLHTLSHLAEYAICIPRHVCQGMYFYTTLSFGRGVKVGVNLAISLPQLLSTVQTWNVYKIRNTLAMVVLWIFGKWQAELSENCESLHEWAIHNYSDLIHNSKARVIHNSRPAYTCLADNSWDLDGNSKAMMDDNSVAKRQDCQIATKLRGNVTVGYTLSYGLRAGCSSLRRKYS